MIPAGLAHKTHRPDLRIALQELEERSGCIPVVGEDHDPRIRIGLYLLQKYPPGRSGLGMLCLEIGQSDHNSPKPGVLNYAARGLGAAPGERFPLQPLKIPGQSIRSLSLRQLHGVIKL